MAALLVAGAGFVVLAALAIRYTEIPFGRYISAGVPPILAIGVLLGLLAARPLLRRFHPRLCPDGRAMLLLYLVAAVAVWVMGQYGVRAFLPHLVGLQYWGQSDTTLAPYAEHLPKWYAPAGEDVASRYWEGSRTGGVPWGVWLPVLLRWAPFFLALFASSFCLMLLLRRQWLHSERLSFPLLTLPLALAKDGGARFAGERRSLARHPLMWLGFGLAAVFNALNIGHALIPSVPAPGFYYVLGTLGFARPWTALNSVMLFFMLDVIGFGYFVPLDVSFSTWFLYLVEKGVAVSGTAAGYDLPGYPFIQDQSAGACVACGLALLWGARRALAATWRAAGRGWGEERWAWMGLAASCAVLLGWAWAAGLALAVAVPYFLVLGCFVLLYARMRAEAGVPLEFVYPYGLPKEMVLNAFSVPGVTGVGGVQSMVIFSSLAWLSRHHLAGTMAAYQADALKLADQERISRRTLAAVLGVAFLLALAGGFWAHLAGFYHVGSNVASSGFGEYRGQVATQEFQAMASRLSAPPPRDWTRLTANGAGAVVTLALAAARARIPGFPLHPLGYVLATAYGDHSTSFFPLFTAWFLKLAILKAGGLKLYRQGIPFFMGLIIGHFFVGGILWTLLSLLISPESSRSYALFFAG